MADGEQWERMAQRHLEREGLQFLEGNYHCRRGELDLIMRDDIGVVFVEVRYRRSADYGSGAESVDARKRARLIATASHWLLTHPKLAGSPCRFDVVSISGAPAKPDVDWIRDAFSAT
jgi:putative endonuclease